MIKERAMELVVALRSGKYKQGKEWLRKGDAFCCLGVACDLYDRTGWRKTSTDEFYHQENRSITLPTLVAGYFGFNTPEGSTRNGAIIWDNKEGRGSVSLTDANDSGATFAALADYIEANWENL